MPASHNWQISQIVELVTLTRPKTIPDVGTEFGKYGFLRREYLDVGSYSQYNRRPTRIDGIEVFAPYATEMHWLAYNNV